MCMYTHMDLCTKPYKWAYVHKYMYTYKYVDMYIYVYQKPQKPKNLKNPQSPKNLKTRKPQH